MPVNGNIDIEYLANFWIENIKPPLMNALDLAPDDKLDWAPAEKMISLGNIFMHIPECSAWWISKLIDGIDFDDLTPGQSLPKNKIAGLLDQHWQRLDGFFARTPDILSTNYSYHHDGKDWNFEGRWIMIHVLEHDLHHRSQINQYLRILGIAPPKI
ncbi:MAG: DinB family protein [candidate division Zixibacteria bacterium]|nr:DinB family protein [candidate division Zixibacteria bacterium]